MAPLPLFIPSFTVPASFSFTCVTLTLSSLNPSPPALCSSGLLSPLYLIYLFCSWLIESVIQLPPATPPPLLASFHSFSPQRQKQTHGAVNNPHLVLWLHSAGGLYLCVQEKNIDKKIENMPRCSIISQKTVITCVCVLMCVCIH